MIGSRDKQTVTANGVRANAPSIDGVRIVQLHNILTRSGIMTEVFRSDWFGSINVRQINWVELAPNGVTDWHCHTIQTDRLVGVSGKIKLCLFDARENSPTYGASDVIRMGIAAPIMVTFPPGVWHGLRNESGAAAGYLNIIDELYNHETPDNFRLAHDSQEIPVAL